MHDFNTLDVFLHNELIGSITNLPGDKNLFTFSQTYSDHPKATLSQSFKDIKGNLITEQKIVRTRLPPFFSNLLPEGYLREYLAKQTNINATREFYLLAALGQDLPGALKILPASTSSSTFIKEAYLDQEFSAATHEPVLRFSLAGVQLKFSAIWESGKGLTIPCDGTGGAWIVKLPSPIYAHVTENEFAMLELARALGIDVPETSLVPLSEIKGLPQGMYQQHSQAFITKRFDRDSSGQGIHIEDFAQVFGVFPEKKYQAASFRNIAQVIYLEVGEAATVEFVRRFLFNALIANGDMHLKNWSLIYANQVDAQLAPAYDFVSTLPYIPNDNLALTFVDSKEFSALSYEQFVRFAHKAELPQTLVVDTVRETVKAFKKVWRCALDFKLPLPIYHVIEGHLKTIPVYSHE